MWQKRTALIIVVVFALVALGLWQARDAFVEPQAKVNPKTSPTLDAIAGPDARTNPEASQTGNPLAEPDMRIDPEASEDLTRTLTGKPPLN